MNFKFNQKLVCVHDNYKSYCAFPLKKGKVYTVQGFHKCQCGSFQINLKEVEPVVLMRCGCGAVSMRRQSYYYWRFRPLQYYYLNMQLFENKKELGDGVEVPKLNQKILKINYQL